MEKKRSYIYALFYLSPDFENNSWVYLSYAESADDHSTIGAVVVRAKFNLKNSSLTLTSVEKLWVQEPKVTGKGHYSHRIAFGPDGKMFITSGDRQKLAPAQHFNSHLGKVLRLNDDGTVPNDNPWQNRGEMAKQFWSIGHRNMLGVDFDDEGRLWVHEMGPLHGDELNLIIAGKNYGWPIVSNGDHYSGEPIPDHHTRPDFEAPRKFWVPSIAPSGLVIYDGEMFADWKGSAIIGGLVSRAMIRVDLKKDTAVEADYDPFSDCERLDRRSGPDCRRRPTDYLAGIRSTQSFKLANRCFQPSPIFRIDVPVSDPSRPSADLPPATFAARPEALPRADGAAETVLSAACPAL